MNMGRSTSFLQYGSGLFSTSQAVLPDCKGELFDEIIGTLPYHDTFNQGCQSPARGEVRR